MAPPASRLVHRTAMVRLRLTRQQITRCYGLLRSAGDVWAWLLDTARQRQQQGERPVSGYQALCRQLTSAGSFGELSTVGARSVLRRYSDAWFQAAKRHKAGKPAGFPRRKRALVPVRFYYGTFAIQRQRVRLPVARGQPELWVRLTRPLPYPPQQIRAVTLMADGGQLWLAVTAAVPIQQLHELDPGRVAGVDLDIIHPYAVVSEDTGLLVSGRALRAENDLHREDQQVRQIKAARRAPKQGRHGSRRWRRYRRREHRAAARHRRRIYQAQHQAAKQVIAFAIQQRVGIVVIGNAAGITRRDAGRVQNWRLRQWRRTHLVRALRDKAELAGMVVRLVDERGTSSTCPACRQRVPKPNGRRFSCPHCRFHGHRDLVGAANIAAKAGGGLTSAGLPTLVEHRRAGIVPARRGRRRHLHDQRRRSCLASGHPQDDPVSRGCRSPRVPDLTPGEDQVALPDRENAA